MRGLPGNVSLCKTSRRQETAGRPLVAPLGACAWKRNRTLRAPGPSPGGIIFDGSSCTPLTPASQSLSLRFIHIADVHLDTAFAGRSDDMRDRLQRASRKAFARCAETAVAEQVDAVLIAGDLFDGSRLSFKTERFLMEHLATLGEAGIQVIYATGNHDPGRGIRAADLEWPGNVTVIPNAEPRTVPVTGRTGERTGYVAGVGHATSLEVEDLSLRLRPRAGTRLPQAAVLHTQVIPATATAVHRPYAPSTIGHLCEAGFHYWALGHVHLRQALSTSPPVYYSGNLQGRTPGETGPKGGLLVDLRNPEAPEVEFREFAPIRWEKLEISALGGVHTLERLVRSVADAWEKARSADPGGTHTEWMLVVDLTGPSTLWREVRKPEEVETIEEEIANRLGILSAEVRTDKVYPEASTEDHANRPDVLGAILRLAREVAAGTEDLGLSEEDFAGFGREQDGSIDAYVRRLAVGSGEEILARMLDPEGSGA